MVTSGLWGMGGVTDNVKNKMKLLAYLLLNCCENYEIQNLIIHHKIIIKLFILSILITTPLSLF